MLLTPSFLCHKDTAPGTEILYLCIFWGKKCSKYEPFVALSCVFITISDLWWTSLQLVSWYLIKYFNFFWKICWNIFKAKICWRSVHGPRGSGLLVHCRDSTGREAVGRHDDLLRCWGGGGGACWQEEGRRQEVQEGKEMQGKRKGKRFAYLIIPRSLTAFCR